ncbi:hypothetical protein L6452_39160 [Arctium lappa]|uniref:Uncharacterized protein n=1 Tax=Arctium lappa TaxID=4217 RepID=A0ACB8XR20_ARCLA|nr:hypothetical protein L6452_39160 [Arctium lappa]
MLEWHDMGIDNSDQHKDNDIELGDHLQHNGNELGDQEKDKRSEVSDQEKYNGIEVDYEDNFDRTEVVEKGDASDHESNNEQSYESETDDSDYIVDEVDKVDIDIRAFDLHTDVEALWISRREEQVSGEGNNIVVDAVDHDNFEINTDESEICLKTLNPSLEFLSRRNEENDIDQALGDLTDDYDVTPQNGIGEEERWWLVAEIGEDDCPDDSEESD